jgi:hypothetical protein
MPDKLKLREPACRRVFQHTSTIYAIAAGCVACPLAVCQPRGVGSSHLPWSALWDRALRGGVVKYLMNTYGPPDGLDRKDADAVRLTASARAAAAAAAIVAIQPSVSSAEMCMLLHLAAASKERFPMS